MDTIKKTIYISPEANSWLINHGNQSDVIDKLILEKIENEKYMSRQYVSKDEVFKIIEDYIKNNAIEITKVKEKVNNKVVNAAKGLINL
jgi:hypothetical protein